MILSVPKSFKSFPLNSPSKSKEEFQDDVAQEIQKLRESLGENDEQEKHDSQMQVVQDYQIVSCQECLNDQDPIA
jgi:molybdopterin converting factor small subunit